MIRHHSNSSIFNYCSRWVLKNIRRISVFSAVLAVIILLPFNYHNSNYESKRSIENEKMWSYSNPGSVVAVINTPKSGTGGLSQTFINSWECQDGINSPTFLTYNCPRNRIVIRSHDAYSGAEIVRQHREAYPEGRCLIVSAIRDPAAWFPSLYSQKIRICEAASTPKEEMLKDYRQFLANLSLIVQSAESCLPGLMKEFNGGRLIDQAKIMDENGGYSVLTTASSRSVFSGCELLFLRMEQSKKWPYIMQSMMPEIKFYRGESQESLCSALSDHLKMLQDYELTKEEKMAIYSHGSTMVKDWFDSYGYMNGISEDNNLMESVPDQAKVEGSDIIMTSNGRVEENEGSYSTPESIIAVISTPKTGTGGLTQNFIHTWDCKNGFEDSYHLTYNCPNDRLVVRAHNYSAGVGAIMKHRKAHPGAQCLIVTSIRSPGYWLPSLYIQKKRICEGVSITKEEMFQDYQRFLAESSLILESAISCLPQMMSDFNGGSLTEQVEIMDQNGGYSILLPASYESNLGGCELLFLKLENSDQWPDIIKKKVPDNKFIRGATRASQCPELEEHIKMLKDYQLTRDEKMSIKNRGGDIMVDWFNAYRYI